MIIEIDALDTLFFRDGKPFSMGEETWADGIFPPPPSVIYGALRTTYISQINQNIALANEPDDKSSELVINGFFLKVKNAPVYPLPLDLVLQKNRSTQEKATEELYNKYIVCPLKLEENVYHSSNENIPFLLILDHTVEELDGGYFSRTSLEAYLARDEKEFTALKLNREVLIEPKTGIARHDITHTTQEEKLYRVGMRRLRDVKLVVEFENLDSLGNKGFIKLGGEAKAGSYQQVDYSPINQPEKMGKWFKLYLSTPGLLKNGWLPEWINPVTLTGKYPDSEAEVKLIAAAIGKPLFIGGFDMKQKMPKEMRKAVPAGSVYYFEMIGETTPDKIASVRPIQLCDYADITNEGFGITYMGKIK
jgi:CRISPR-associated protein Cmr3